MVQKPIYQIIENDIKIKIQQKKLKAGDLIPSENQLKDQYNVSRMTVRQALNNLVTDGYLYKHKGKGTFVSQIKIEKNIQGLRGFTDEMESLGRVVRNEVVGFEIIDPTDDIKDKLFLTNEDDKVIYIERIRYGDDIPVLHEELYLPHYLFKELKEENLYNSFYTYLENDRGLKISHCIQAIEAQMPTKVITDSLQTTRTMPILRITRNTFLSNGRPFEYVISSYRSDQYRFVQYAVKN